MNINKVFWMIRALCFKPFMGAFGLKSYIGKPILITGFKRLFIGSKVRIYPLSRIEVLESGNVIIENDVSIGQCLHIVSGGSLKISKNTTISANVFLSDVEHIYSGIDRHIMEQPLNISSILIGDNCFIGYGAVIRAGTTLGKQCVVGAHSVVKGEFPDYCVIAGNPAKIIKKYNEGTKVWERTLNEN